MDIRSVSGTQQSGLVAVLEEDHIERTGALQKLYTILARLEVSHRSKLPIVLESCKASVKLPYARCDPPRGRPLIVIVGVIQGLFIGVTRDPLSEGRTIPSNTSLRLGQDA
jgi:hypothetical protein